MFLDHVLEAIALSYKPLGFWLAWVLATGLGWLFGAVAALFVIALVASSAETAIFVLSLILAGSAMGLIAALSQWVALRSVIAMPARRWVLATAAGAAAGMPPFVFSMGLAGPGSLWQLLAGWALAAALVGACQSVALRPFMPRSTWWLAANIAAATIAAIIFYWTDTAPVPLPVDSTAVLFVASPLVYGVITATALAGSLKHRRTT